MVTLAGSAVKMRPRASASDDSRAADDSVHVTSRNAEMRRP